MSISKLCQLCVVRMDPLLFWTYWCCRVCGPPLWQRSVKEELLAARTAGRTSVTGLMKTVRPPGTQMLTNHRGNNWEHKKVCYHFAIQPCTFGAANASHICPRNKKGAWDLCLRPSTAALCHPSPCKTCTGRASWKSKQKRPTFKSFNKSRWHLCHLVPVPNSSLQGLGRDSQCPVPAQGVQGESTGPEREMIQEIQVVQVVQLVQVPGMKGSGRLWVAYGSEYADCENNK